MFTEIVLGDPMLYDDPVSNRTEKVRVPSKGGDVGMPITRVFVLSAVLKSREWKSESKFSGHVAEPSTDLNETLVPKKSLSGGPSTMTGIIASPDACEIEIEAEPKFTVGVLVVSASRHAVYTAKFKSAQNIVFIW
jgi:hypothetical protein